jgi:AcrR family transcriptional regulator
MLQAASDIFLSHGFDGTTMDKVAEAAGVSKQTVYSHFGNKDDLFTAVIEYKCQSHALTDELFDLSKPVAEVLLELAHDFSALITSDDAIRLHRACAAGAEQRSNVAELFFNAGPRNIKSKLMRYLEQQNELAIDNSRFAATAFFGLMRSEYHFRRELGLALGDTEQQLGPYLKSAVALFIRGYRQSA